MYDECIEMEVFAMVIIFIVALVFILYYDTFKRCKNMDNDNEKLEEKLLLDIYAYGKSINDSPIFDSKQTLVTGFPTLMTTVEELDDKSSLVEETRRRC